MKNYMAPDRRNTSGGQGSTRDELRVLLVDDHDDMLAMMNLFMSRHNFAVATANSGPQALLLMESFEPHVVVSDIAMPGMDGYEMMSALRATDLGSSFKSIALSGYDMEDDRDKARAAGYDAHMAKPIDFDVLFEMIDHLVSMNFETSLPAEPAHGPAKPSAE